MNIGIVTTWFERGAAYVSKQYYNLLKEKHNVYIFARGGERKAIGIKEWDKTYVHWADKDCGTFIDEDEFERWINDNKIDCVFFNEQQSWQIILYCNANHILCGAYIDYYTEETAPFFQHYDFVICNTKKHFSVFKDLPQSYYVPWGTNVELYKPTSQFLVNESKVTFFHSAGLNPKRKGTIPLIRAFDKLSKQYPNKVKLVVHSQVAIKEDMIEENSDIELITKTVSAPGLYFLGDVYVYPTELEGIGLTIAEALASGLPAIVTDNAPMTEFGNDEILKRISVESYYTRRDAYYFPLAKVDEDSIYNQMEYFVNNMQIISKLKRKARKYAMDKLDWKKNKELLSQIFSSVKLLPHNMADETAINSYNQKLLSLGDNMKLYLHEIDRIDKQIHQFKNRKIFFYPAGTMTKAVIGAINLEGLDIMGVIDKNGAVIPGYNTYDIGILSQYKDALVVITRSIYEEQIRQAINAVEEFEGEIITAFLDKPRVDLNILKGKLSIPRMDLVLTAKCTLRCEKCANLMQYYEHAKDVPLDMLYKSMGKLLSVVDWIGKVYVLGGEPFLYKNLREVIMFLKRFDKIKEIIVVTNGTICPKEDDLIWKELHAPQTIISVSDYGKLSVNKEKLIKQCEINHINYMYEEQKVFFDTGNMKKRERTSEQLQKVFKDCSTQCRSLYMGELHYCPRSSHGTDLGLVSKKKDDYVDLMTDENDSIVRDKVQNFVTRQKYIETCDYCDIRTPGYYEKEFPAGVQANHVIHV